MTFFSRNFLECLQHDVSSFLLLSVGISGLTNYEIFLPQAQITFLSNVRVRPSLFYFTPFDVELNVLVFQVPYVFTELDSVPVPFVSK